MFTGIIQGIGTVVQKSPAGGGVVLTIEADFDLTDPEEGESIAVNGACLTARNHQREAISGRCFTGEPFPYGSWKIDCGFPGKPGESASTQ